MESPRDRDTSVFSGTGPINPTRNNSGGPQEQQVNFSTLPSAALSPRSTSHSLIGPSPPADSTRLRRLASSRNISAHSFVFSAHRHSFGTLSPDLFANMSGSRDMITGLTPTQRPSRAKKGKRVHNCTHPGCEKIFTRAEHLRRHQLNHSSEVLYRCNSCDKRFVRQDLLNRHAERHATPSYRVEHTSPEAESSSLPHAAASPAFSDASSTFGGSDVDSHIFDPALSMYAPASPAFAVSGPIVTSSMMDNSILAMPGVTDSYRMGYPMVSAYGVDISRSASPSQLHYAPRAPHFLSGQPHREYYPRPPKPSRSVPADAILPSHPSPNETWEGELPQIQIDGGLEGMKVGPINGLGMGVEREIRDITEGFPSEYASRPRRTNPQTLYGMDEVTRSQLLFLVGHPDNVQFYETTLEAMQGYVGTYWRIVHQLYPILHQPTFNPLQNIWLTAMVVALGASFTSPEAHAFGISLYEKVKEYTNSVDFQNNFYQSVSLQQTLFLSNVFSKMRLGAESTDIDNYMSIKLGEYLRQVPVPPVSSTSYAHRLKSMEQTGVKWDMNAEWQAWITMESKRRISTSFLVWDVQQAAMFGTRLQSTSQQLNQAIISKEDHILWCSDSAIDWYEKIQLSSSQRQFIDVLKTCLDPQAPFPDLSYGESNLILHGLLSILLDYFQTAADATALRNGPSEKVARLKHAFEKWRTNYRENVEPHVSDNFSMRCNELYMLAQLHLTTNLDVLRVAAGDNRAFTGDVLLKGFGGITQEQREELTVWAASENGKQAVFSAAEFLSKAFRTTRDFEVEPHMAWCIYIATLVCWAFEEYSTQQPATSTSKGAWSPQTATAEYISSVLAHGVPSSISQSGTMSATGLLLYARSLTLTNRWGLLPYSGGILGHLAKSRGIYLQH